MADSTRLTLWLAENVIRQSGLLEAGIPRERIGVLISQNSGETAATIKDLTFDVYSEEIVQLIQDLIPMTPEFRAEADSLPGERGFVSECTWNVSGSVGHWGHIHQRKNRYEAELTVQPVDDRWKVTRLDLLHEERL